MHAQQASSLLSIITIFILSILLEHSKQGRPAAPNLKRTHTFVRSHHDIDTIHFAALPRSYAIYMKQ